MTYIYVFLGINDKTKEVRIFGAIEDVENPKKRLMYLNHLRKGFAERNLGYTIMHKKIKLTKI